MGDVLNDGLHGLNDFQFRSCEKRADLIHLGKEFANGVVKMYLVNDDLQLVD